MPNPMAQASTKIQALIHLTKIKMATGEYAAAWDARNAANRLRDEERRRAELNTLEQPLSVVTVGELLGKHDREMDELRLEQRRRHARLDMELANELERRGIVVETEATASRREWERQRRGGDEHQRQWNEHTERRRLLLASSSSSDPHHASPPGGHNVGGHVAAADDDDINRRPLPGSTREAGYHPSPGTPFGEETAAVAAAAATPTRMPPPLSTTTPSRKFSAVGSFLRALGEDREDGGGKVAADAIHSPHSSVRGLFPEKTTSSSPLGGHHVYHCVVGGGGGGSGGGEAPPGMSVGVGNGFGATSAMAGSLMSMRANANVNVGASLSSSAAGMSPSFSERLVAEKRSAAENNATEHSAASAGGAIIALDSTNGGIIDGTPAALGWWGQSDAAEAETMATPTALDPLSPAMRGLVVSGVGEGGMEQHTFGHGSWLRPPQPPPSSPFGPTNPTPTTSSSPAAAAAAATPPAWRPAKSEDELEPLTLNQVLHPREIRAMTHARCRDPHTRASAARMHGDGLTRGFSAAHGQRGAEVVSPWGAAAATSGRMFLRAGEDDTLAPDSVHEKGGGDYWGNVRNVNNNADARNNRGQVVSRSAAIRHGFLEARIFPPAQPPMTDAEAEAAARHPGNSHHADQYVDSVYGGGGEAAPSAPSAPPPPPEFVVSKHQYASRYMAGKVLGGYGESPGVDPATGGPMTFDGTIRDAGEYATRRAMLLHDAVADHEVAGERGMGDAVRTVMDSGEEEEYLSRIGGGGGGGPGGRGRHSVSTVTQSQVTEVVDKVKEARRLSHAGVAGKNIAAGQPRVETAIIAATAAPEFREHLYAAGGVGDELSKMAGDIPADDTPADGRSRGRTPTGGFAEDRRAPPRGLGLPSNVFSPLKLQT